jgi:phage shock protein PspC (stress-responsive transcriptional regulator)
MDDGRDSARSIGLIAGGALVLLGAWFLLRDTGLIPAWFAETWSRAAWPVAIIVVGVAILVISARGGLSIRGPRPGARLYKSRTDKWVDGVLGGLGEYLGVDPVVLRLAFIVLVLAGWGALILAYIVLAIVVPREPAGTGADAT